MEANPSPAYQRRLDALKALGLPNDQYAVFGSGPLAIRGLREAQDIDLVVREPLWSRLCARHPPSGENGVALSEDIEAFNDWPWCTQSPEELIRQADLYEGIRFVRLDDVIAYKQRRARPKDLADIALIAAGTSGPRSSE